MTATKKKATSPLLDALFEKANIKPDSTKMPAQYWEELDTLYEANAISILEISTNVNEAIRTIRNNGIEQSAELAVTTNGFTRDITQYTTDLVHIRSHHKDKKGELKDGAELALFLSISEDYIAWSERFRANSLPVMLVITDHMQEAAGKAASKAQQELQDPNVISDVEVKETPNV
jgi:hypothetical protein